MNRCGREKITRSSVLARQLETVGCYSRTQKEPYKALIRLQRFSVYGFHGRSNIGAYGLKDAICSLQRESLALVGKLLSRSTRTLYRALAALM